MKNIRKFFSDLYMDCKMDNEKFEQVSDLEKQVFDWYNNDEEKFDKWVEENNIDIDDVVYMMDGDQEYVLTLWVWDMED